MRCISFTLALFTQAIAASIVCEFTTTESVKTIKVIPEVPVSIPELPYHIKCSHNTNILLNTSRVIPGIRSTLHVKEYPGSDTFTPFHLSYTHHNPLLVRVKHVDTLPPLLLETRTEESAKVEQGFLRKYWMYIVPFFVIMFMTSSGDEEPGTPAAKAVE